MKSKIIPSIIFCIFFICNHLSFAQIITPKDTTTAVINGKLFYVHKVIKNESLYGIARDYNITVKEITDANPKIGNGLKAGRILYIPIKAVKNPSNPPTDKFVDTSKKKSLKFDYYCLSISLPVRRWIQLKLSSINHGMQTQFPPLSFMKG